MRLNQFIAQATGMSRRQADAVISEGRILVNNQVPSAGYQVQPLDIVLLDGTPVQKPLQTTTIILNKPVGYVCSRNGQGSKTIYELLPAELHHLKSVGRLDKDSSGLLLLTDDGQLANELTHPRYAKTKVYEIALNKPLDSLHRQMITDRGVDLADGPSKLGLERLLDGNDKMWRITMQEGRNRQIRRTFEALGYKVVRLHRISFGNYTLGDLPSGQFTTSVR